MLGRSLGLGLLAAFGLLVFFGYSSSQKLPELSPHALLAETRALVKPDIPKRFPQTIHDVFFSIKSPREWKSIVFHHSATASGSASAFDRYHRDVLHDPNGIRYHFVIGNGTGSPNGAIEVTDRWRRQIDATHLYNPDKAPDSIAICLVGNFEQSEPTEAQKQSAVKLAYVLMRRFHLNVNHVRTHREIDVGRTACPGCLFPIQLFRNALTALAGR